MSLNSGPISHPISGAIPGATWMWCYLDIVPRIVLLDLSDGVLWLERYCFCLVAPYPRLILSACDSRSVKILILMAEEIFSP
jgi:hypothetical protein